MADFIPTTPPLFQTSLAFPLGPTDTTFTIADDLMLNNVPLAGLICASIDIGEPNPEYIVGTLLNDVVTIIRRNVDPLDPTIAGATPQQEHRRGAVVKITDFATIQIMRNILSGLQPLENKIAYKTQPATFNPLELVDAQYVASAFINGAFNYFVDSGSANNIVITPSPALTAYTAGMSFFIKVKIINTGPTTINVNGIGPIPLKKQVAVDLDAGNILTNQVILVEYDGTNFQMIGSGGGSGASSGGGIVTRSAKGSFALTPTVTETIDTEGVSGANAGNLMSDDASIRNLYINFENNTLDGATVLTLIRNGVPTAVTVSVAAGVNGVFMDIANSFAVVGGDLISLSCDTSASTLGGGNISFSYQVGNRNDGTIIRQIANQDLNPGQVAGVSPFIGGVALAKRSAISNVLTNGDAIDQSEMVWIGDDRFFLLYGTSTGGGGPLLRGIIGTIDRNTMAITYGTAVTINADPVVIANGSGSDYMMSLAKLDTDKVVVFYSANSTNVEIRLVACTVAGTVITTTTEQPFVNRGALIYDISAVGIDVDTVAVYENANVTSGEVITVTFTGTTINVIGAPVGTVASKWRTGAITKIDTNAFAIPFSNGGGTNETLLQAGSAVGTVTTLGSAVTLINFQSAGAYAAQGLTDIVSPSPNVIVVTATDDAGSTSPTYIACATVAANVITVGNTINYNNNTDLVGIAVVDTTHVLIKSTSAVSVYSVIANTLASAYDMTDPLDTDIFQMRKFSYRLYVDFGGVYWMMSSYMSNKLFILGMTANYMGINELAVALGGSASILIKGKDSNQSGLIVGERYGAQSGGFVIDPLGTAVAVSATEIVI